MRAQSYLSTYAYVRYTEKKIMPESKRASRGADGEQGSRRRRKRAGDESWRRICSMRLRR